MSALGPGPLAGMRSRWNRWCPAIALALTASAASGATFRDDGDTLVLENARVRFVFSRAFAGCLTGLVDREAGVDLMAGLAYPAALFVLESRGSACSLRQAHNLSGGGFSAEGRSSGATATLDMTYSGTDEGRYDVVVSVELGDDSPRARFTIAVTPRAPGETLSAVTFPGAALRLPLGTSGADDELAFPALDGVVLHDPSVAMVPGDGLSATYPADLSLQMAAVYDASTGLYVTTPDAGLHPKTFGIARSDISGTPALVLQIRHLLPERAGSAVTLPYPVELEPFSGDWFDAAQLYRAWVRGAFPGIKPLTSRSDVPAWWRAAPGEITAVAYGDDGAAHVPAAAMAGRAGEWSGFLGNPVNLLMYGWEKHGAWTGPDYFPPRDGTTAFGAGSAALRAAGNHLYVYLSGTGWRLLRPQLPAFDGWPMFEAEGRDAAALTCDGQPLHDAFYATIGWDSVRMCPGAEAWRERVAAAVESVAALGVDIVSVDEFPIGAIYPCFSATHDHPPGAGSWQGQGLRELLGLARSRGRAVNPALAMTAEEPNEAYVDLLDGYLSRENAPDGFMTGPLLLRYGDRFETVPLFAAVYHDSVVGVAEAMPVYDAYGHLEALRTSMSRGLAAAFVLGRVPAATSAPLGGSDPQLVDLFRRAVRAVAGPAHDFAILGRLMRPPVLAVPRVAFQWVDVDLVSGALVLRDQTAPSVLASAWQAPDRRRAVLLANITPAPRTVTVPLDVTALDPPYLVTRHLDGAYEVLASGNSPPAAVTTTLPGWGLATVIVAGETTPHLVRRRLRRAP